MRWLIFLLIVLFVFTSCVQHELLQENKLTGLQVSEATRNEDNKIVHDITNPDDFTHIVNVTTLCYDGSGNIMDDSDSYVLEIPPNMFQAWRPECPNGTADYKIDIVEVN